MTEETDPSYGPTADVAKTLTVQLPQDNPDAQTPASFRIYGPGCSGCVRHEKAIMMSFTLKPHETIYDVFLGAETAAELVSALDQLRPRAQGEGLTISFTKIIDGKSLNFLITDEMVARLYEVLDFDRTSINAFIKGWRKAGVAEPVPARQLPPTPEEIKAAKEWMAKRYKPEPRDVSLEGVDIGTLLAALYNNATTGGAGSMHYRDELMTPKEARHILNELTRIGALWEIDYINGRSIKYWIGHEDGQYTQKFSRYWDYNGIPAAALVELARKGVYGRLPNRDAIDVENEAAILAKSAGKENLPVSLEQLAEEIRKTQNFYIEARRPASTPATYQISIAGNGAVRHEVGHLIAPYEEGNSVPPLAPPPQPR